MSRTLFILTVGIVIAGAFLLKPGQVEKMINFLSSVVREGLGAFM